MATALASSVLGAPQFAPLASPTCSTSAASRVRSCPHVARRGSHLQVVCMAAKGDGVESDLSEEVRESWRTAGEESQENNTYPYGKVDGAHSWHKGDDGPVWDNINAAIEEAGGPTSPGQKAIAWLFLPAFFSLIAFGAPPEYYMGFTVLFIFAYIGIEMDKPTKPTHFEPDMYKIKK